MLTTLARVLSAFYALISCLRLIVCIAYQTGNVWEAHAALAPRQPPRRVGPLSAPACPSARILHLIRVA